MPGSFPPVTLSGEAMVKIWLARTAQVASSVLVAVGLGFTVPELDQPGGRVSACPLAKRLERGVVPG